MEKKLYNEAKLEIIDLKNDNILCDSIQLGADGGDMNTTGYNPFGA